MESTNHLLGHLCRTLSELPRYKQHFNWFFLPKQWRVRFVQRHIHILILIVMEILVIQVSASLAITVLMTIDLRTVLHRDTF